MASDTPSIMVQSVRTSRSSFSSSNGYETPSHYSAITNGDDYDSDGSNFAPPTPMTLLNSILAELAGAIPLIDKFQVEGFLRAMQKVCNSIKNHYGSQVLTVTCWTDMGLNGWKTFTRLQVS